jgi:hypothetical protein
MTNDNPVSMTDDELRSALGLEDDPNYAGKMSPEEVAAYLEEMKDESLTAAWDDFDSLMLELPDFLSRLEKLLANSQADHPPVSFAKGSDELYRDEKAFQADTIANVEGLFLAVLEQDEMSEEVLDELKICVGLFLGEAIAENLGGEWQICTDKTSADYGKPVVALWEGDSYGPPLNPFVVVEILAQTRRAGVLIGAIHGMKQGSEKVDGKV